MKQPAKPYRYCAPLLIVLIGLLSYANVVTGPFLFDDEHFIVKNAYIRDFKYIKEIFTSSVTSGMGLSDNFYRPLSVVAFLLIFKTAGLSSIAFHLANVLVHIGAGLLVYLLLVLLIKNRAAGFLGAALFTIHPVQTEAVSYACGLAEPLSMVFILLTLWLYHSSVRGNRPFVLYLGVPLVYVLSVLTKERALVLAVLIPLFDFSFLKGKEEKIPRQRKYLWGVLFFIVLAYVGLRLTVLNFENTLNFFKTSNLYTESLCVRLYTFCYTFLLYLKIAVLPWPLHMERNISVFTSWIYPHVWGGMLLFFLGVLAAVFDFLKGKRVFFFSFLWFMGFLMPTSGIIPVNALMMEHWLYFSLFGVALLFGYGCSLLSRGGQKTLVIPVACIIGCMVFTIYQNSYWTDTIRFYQHILRYNPLSVAAHNNIGMALAEAERYDEALAHYNASAQIDGTRPEPHHNMGRLHLYQGRVEDALREFHQAIEIDDSFYFSHLELTKIYQDLGEQKKALYHYQKALSTTTP